MSLRPRRPADSVRHMADPSMNRYAAPQRLVRINRRRRLNVNLSGAGAPTVILSAGAGCSTLHWGLVQGPLGRTNRVLSFDRAGMGFSDPGPLPRTTFRVVADLRAALAALGEGPPYVLVGHSMGSFDVRLFAFLHPEEVAGVVLVDPRGNRIGERFSAVSPRLEALLRDEPRQFRRNAALLRSGLSPGTAEYDLIVGEPDPMLSDEVNDAQRNLVLRPSYWRTVASEGDAANGLSAEELRAAERRLNVPLIILSAERQPMPGLSAAEMLAVNVQWRAAHDELAELSPRALVRHVSDVGHMIQLERPDIVIDAIREVIAMAQA
jgi:pimeloyl-ACP methyl ester carboxylesterase